MIGETAAPKGGRRKTGDFMDNKVLEIRHLTKRYGAKVAVDDLSLDVCAGDIYGFIGQNGAGKTTTLRAVTASSVSTKAKFSSTAIP